MRIKITDAMVERAQTVRSNVDFKGYKFRLDIKKKHPDMPDSEIQKLFNEWYWRSFVEGVLGNDAVEFEDKDPVKIDGPMHDPAAAYDFQETADEYYGLLDAEEERAFARPEVLEAPALEEAPSLETAPRGPITLW